MTRTATVTSGLLLLVACGDGLRAARLRAPSTPADTRRCTRSRVVSRAADDEAEVDRVLAGLQLEEDGGSDSRKYMPSTGPDDPIARALRDVCGAREVLSLDLLDSRWNGNEVLRYETDAGRFFVKMNRVEDVSVFMMEAVSLTALIKAGAVRAPKPLHLGPLPRVGDFGPGAFMVLEYLDMKPFGSMQKETQRALGEQLAALHGSRAHDSVHQGRYGFVVNNFLALTPLNNTWADEWHTFFAGRLRGQLDSLHSAKAYAKVRAARAGAWACAARRRARTPVRPPGARTGRRAGARGGACARGTRGARGGDGGAVGRFCCAHTCVPHLL